MTNKIILLNKPFNVLSQFTDTQGRTNLKDFLADYPGFYAAGRLDYDSEGLLLLTNDGAIQQQISAPKHQLEKTYWAQVDGQISDAALQQLRSGVTLKDGKTQAAKAKRIEAPELWSRTPPVRFRANIPTSWIELSISEGRNRQVRRMTAAVGFPILRLIRVAIGPWRLENLQPGEYRLDDAPSLENPRKTPSKYKRQNNKPAKRR